MNQPPANAAVPAPTFREALAYWFRLGCISFGGPAGQIAIMQTELVDRKRWIGQAAFLRGLNFATLLPGPEAQQLATYIGWRLHGTLGGIVAGALFVLPGAAVLLVLSWLAAAYGHVPTVSAIFDGLKPVMIAVIAHAILRLGRRALRTWHAIVLALIAFAAIRFLDVDFPWIVLASGIIGWIAALRGFDVFASVGHGKTDTAAPVPARRGGLSRAVTLIAIFAVLWLVPVWLTIRWAGMAPFAGIAELFTKAAFVTFGGAYAVLPYVAEAAVNDYRWLTPGEMLNGLALAETTPGPLILVLQYVGFFAGWNHPGALSPLAAGVLGAALTTYVTFLPSFLFILLGAPYVESLHENRSIGSALGAITAAVVGVMLNLAVFLGWQVFYAAAGRIDVFAIVVALAAFVALHRFAVAIHWLVIAGAVLGVAWRMIAP